jgi:exopolysaccharide biosynthesis protein
MSFVVAALVASAAGHNAFRPISYASFKHAHHFYHEVMVNLDCGACLPGTVHSQNLTSVHTLVDGSQPMVAITGTFFSPGSQRPVADVLVDGNLVAKGSRGTAVAVDYQGQVSIFDEPFNKEIDWSGYKFGLRGAVRVVDGGRVRPDPKAQRFHDAHIWGRAARAGLGLTESGKLLLFATKEKVTLSEFGKAMKSRGVRNGVSLDGGSSTCMYYNGAFLIPPQRKLSNMFVVCQRAE